MEDLLCLTRSGLYCPSGGFYIDPWRPVKNALITHTHSDHARGGSQVYFAARGGERLIKKRLGSEITVRTFNYREPFQMGEVKVSFHPAGHILGSSQIRVESKEETWVVSGDYKRDYDPTCETFEEVACDVFITESTFGYPIYQWKEGEKTAEEIFNWWKDNQRQSRASLLLCYSLGKAQRILAHLKHFTSQPVYLHGATAALSQVYLEEGISLTPWRTVLEAKEKTTKKDWAGELILAPPSVLGSPWVKRFGEIEIGFASGWMQIRGNRKRRGIDRGFVLSDHADWPSLIRTVKASRAKRVLVTHGNAEILSQYLCEKGIDAKPLKTEFLGESE